MRDESLLIILAALCALLSLSVKLSLNLFSFLLLIKIIIYLFFKFEQGKIKNSLRICRFIYILKLLLCLVHYTCSLSRERIQITFIAFPPCPPSYVKVYKRVAGGAQMSTRYYETLARAASAVILFAQKYAYIIDCHHFYSYFCCWRVGWTLLVENFQLTFTWKKKLFLLIK